MGVAGPVGGAAGAGVAAGINKIVIPGLVLADHPGMTIEVTLSADTPS